ncbi:ABC transporter ATP-binding protein [Lentibacillus saliphilus]|uniref:ABC transporter ATP-binding protein n=1 Tax=Lentibacillus saliphilus TaxID=2737028 RepID=UPI001C2F6BF4|nr:ABC transporter ATP-binding protein [Lentibacillus saliphilus]
MTDALLTIDDVNVSFRFSDGHYPALNHISFSVSQNEVVGIVGESGCGKSLTARTIMGILPDNAMLSQGSIMFDDTDLARLDEQEWQAIRGRRISMIFQEPMTSLNPLLTIGRQIEEVLKKHTKKTKRDMKAKTISVMNSVGLPRAEALYKSYPHHLSGGMRQRVVIAMALIGEPDLIIADEPTTALDVTIQAQILDLFKSLKATRNMSMVFISHDWGVIRSVCDRVIVMYAGRIVEEGTVEALLQNPQHPYTKALIQSIPDHTKKGQMLYTIPGTVPGLKERGSGCPFASRCQHKQAICEQKFPEPVRMGEQSVACHLYSEAGVLE